MRPTSGTHCWRATRAGLLSARCALLLLGLASIMSRSGRSHIVVVRACRTRRGGLPRVLRLRGASGEGPASSDPLLQLLILWDHALSQSLVLHQGNASAMGKRIGMRAGNPYNTAPDDLLLQLRALSARVDRKFGQANWSTTLGYNTNQDNMSMANPVHVGLLNQLLAAAENPQIENIDDKIAEIQEVRSSDVKQRMQGAARFINALEAGDKEAGTAQPSREQVRFWKAVDAGDEGEAVRLVASGSVDMDMMDPKHWSQLRAVHRAARLGHTRLLSLLVRRGANLTLTDKYGETVLHTAARQHSVETVATLVDRFDMNVNAQNVWGQTPLHVALDWDGDDQLQTPMGDVRKLRNVSQVDTVKCLVASGANVRALDQTLWTPLHLAARWDRVGAAQILLASGAEVNARTAERHTALDWAAEAPSLRTQRLLLDARAERTLEDGKSVWDTYCRVEGDDVQQPNPFRDLIRHLLDEACANMTHMTGEQKDAIAANIHAFGACGEVGGDSNADDDMYTEAGEGSRKAEEEVESRTRGARGFLDVHESEPERERAREEGAFAQYVESKLEEHSDLADHLANISVSESGLEDESDYP